MDEIKRSLGCDDVEARRKAVEELKGKPADDAIPLLLQALEDKSWRVRKTASEILISGYPMDQYIHGLFRLLYKEDNAGARNSAIETLIRLGRHATPFLTEAFDTPDRDVRKFIVDTVGEIKDRGAVPLLLKALKDEDENVKASAVEHLGQLGEPRVVDELLEILKGGDLWTAYPAAEALGRIGDKRAVPVLLQALSIKALREPIIRALGRLSVVETLEQIVPCLMDKSKVIQEETIKAVEMFYHNGVAPGVITAAVRRICGPEGLEILINHAWSKKQEVRASAVLLLGLMQDARAFKPLLDLSMEEDLADEVRNAFVFIGRSRPDLILPLFDTENPYYRRFIEEVAAVVASPLYGGIFEQDLAHGDGHVRSLAAQGIGNIGDPKGVGPLKRLLGDPYVDVQEATVKALVKLKPGIQVGEFIGLLKDKNPKLRRNAALVLGRIGAVDAVAELGFALKDEDVSVRAAVVEALAALKNEESCRYLLFALTDENPDVRTAATLSLGSFAGAPVLEAISLLTDDTNDKVKAAAARTLGMLGDGKALETLVRLLADHNGFVVTNTMEALGRIGGNDAREALTRMLRSADAEIRRTALVALAGFEGIEDAVLPFVRDPDWATRIAAIETLSKKPVARVRAEVERLYDTEPDPVVRRAIEESFHVG